MKETFHELRLAAPYLFGGSIRETVQQLLKIDPQVKAIVSSGYSDDATANYEKQGFKTFLKKPYDLDALREVLNKLLTR